MTDSAPAASSDVNFTMPRRVGMTIIALVFGVFGIWSLVAPLEGAALAPGIVTVKSYKKTVQHLEGGIVKEILVRDGDQVVAGEVVAVMDSTQARAQLDIALASLFAESAKEVRLLAERDGRDTLELKLPLAQDPRMRAEMKSQQLFFNARKNARRDEISVFNQRIEQYQANVEGLEALKISKETLVASYGEEIADYRELLKDGYADKMRLRELERNQSRLEGEVAERISAIAGTRIQIGETRLQILQLEKDSQSLIIDELGQVQTQLNDLKERVRALRDTLARTEVRSPVDGIVMGLQVHTQGGVIGPGTPILDVVPQGGDLIVEAEVSPADIDRIFLGQISDIRFSSFSSSTTPVITGKVITLSADRLTNQQTGMPYFLAQVEVTPEGMENLAELELLPGMPAEVLINTGARTLFQYLTQPITNAFARSLIEE
ncbi:MAG: epimerase transport system membrane fusion protein [Paraglaciecola psychrophila]|jgi:epimerase transport system membrane fusion protein